MLYECKELVVLQEEAVNGVGEEEAFFILFDVVDEQAEKN